MSDSEYLALRAYRAHIDREIHRRYHTTQYLLIRAGDWPDLNDIPGEAYGSRAAVERARADKIDAWDWQIIEVTTKPVEAKP